jgi:hypothetical protein
VGAAGTDAETAAHFTRRLEAFSDIVFGLSLSRPRRGRLSTVAIRLPRSKTPREIQPRRLSRPRRASRANAINSVRFPPGRLTFAGLAFVATTSVAAAQIGPDERISAAGVGRVHFGMTLGEAAAAGVPLTPAAGQHAGACYLVQPSSPAGLSFMVREGKIVRADMAKPADLRTIDGFKRGDKEADIAGYYAGKAGVSDFPLSDQSDVSVLASPEFSDGNDRPRLVYEVTDADGVTAIHAGWVPLHFGGCPKPAAAG